ncbi:hypothetical protein SUGI_0900460 [Cryptomeria japonica]|nr:hypothetical protein SUGI_0900460 [Cryptomeria japonica]
MVTYYRRDSDGNKLYITWKPTPRSELVNDGFGYYKWIPSLDIAMLRAPKNLRNALREMMYFSSNRSMDAE